MICTKAYGKLLSTTVKVTIDRGDLIRIVITSWNEDLLGVDHLTHDNWVVYFKVTLKFETKILRSDIFAQEPHERSPNAPKFEDLSQEETEWQEQGAREAAWRLVKSVFKLKEQERATFFSPSENRCLPASNLKLEEREFVVDSGASMHMISKKDLSDAEMGTLMKSCSPTIAITANGEVQTHEEAKVYVKELDIFLTMKVLENTPADCRSESFAMKTDIPRNGSMVKNHISIKTGLGFHATRKTSFLLWFQACQVRPLDLHQLQRHLRDRRVILHHLLQPTVSEIQTREREERIDISPVHVSTTVDDRSGRPDDNQANKIPKPNKKESKKEQSDSSYSEIPEWLQEFRENLVDDEIPVQGDSHASSSHEVSLEPTFKRREDLGKHSVYTHFPKDRNCENCQRTKLTRAPCRRRNGGAVPRAKKNWWLDHSRSQNSRWWMWISKQSPMCSCGARLSYSMDSIISMQNRNFTRNREKLAKVPGTREEA